MNRGRFRPVTNKHGRAVYHAPAAPLMYNGGVGFVPLTLLCSIEVDSIMFKPVSSRVSLPEMDAAILDFWKAEDVFHRTESERADGPRFMLFEGPPTANGSPGIHHVLARVFKDVICRHRTMKGFRCLRKGGWDTHGLPVELEIEKELGLTSKREIEEYGIENFNNKCRDSVFRYVKGMGSPHRPHRVLGGHGRPLRHPGKRVHRKRLVDYQAALGQGPGVPGTAGDAPLSPL